MIILDSFRDYFIMLAIAAGGGAIGGLAFELLQIRGQQTGIFEGWGKREGGFDIGGFASIFIGAVAAMAVLYFFPPTITIEAEGADPTTQYDVVQLIALSLIVGSTGGAVLQAAQQQIQQRINARVSEQQLQTTQNVANTQVENSLNTVKDNASNIVKESLATVAEQNNLSMDVIEDPLNAALEKLQDSANYQIDAAKQTISASAEAPLK